TPKTPWRFTHLGCLREGKNADLSFRDPSRPQCRRAGHAPRRGRPAGIRRCQEPDRASPEGGRGPETPAGGARNMRRRPPSPALAPAALGGRRMMRIGGGMVMLLLVSSPAWAANFVPNAGFEACVAASPPDQWTPVAAEGLACDGTAPEAGTFDLALSSAAS